MLASPIPLHAVHMHNIWKVGAVTVTVALLGGFYLVRLGGNPDLPAAVVADRAYARTNQALRQEVAEFGVVKLQNDPATAKPFASARRVLQVALELQVPDPNEVVVAFLDGAPVYQSSSQRKYQTFASDPAFQAAVRDLLPDGGSRRLDTRYGVALMTVEPVSDADHLGAYVPVYFP
jgi:two-component system, OmpR family, sensor kinase